MAAVVPARARPPIIRARLAEELAEGLLRSCIGVTCLTLFTDVTSLTLFTGVTCLTLHHIQLWYSCRRLEEQACKAQCLHELPSLLPR